jgi:hypothetical protein
VDSTEPLQSFENVVHAVRRPSESTGTLVSWSHPWAYASDLFGLRWLVVWRLVLRLV